MTENEIGDSVIAAAMKVHSAVGPGLLESAYEACLRHELQKHELRVQTQVLLPLKYDDLTLDAGYRIDLLIERRVVVELKTVQGLLPIHRAQLLSYLKTRRLQAWIPFELPCRAYARRHYQDGQWPLSCRVLCVTSAVKSFRQETTDDRP